MNLIVIRALCVVFGYIFGLFETAIFVGKAKGIDIRTKGSGNAGTTNTLRTLGLKYGLIVLFGDIMKCLIPCLI
ncbi:MAG: glycerol-3-phosphate acyltransferase, partial [Lachnospiraceae bacterium]|nr:glycerol-3-phosphate acyltransferase [Lachnospiraceae bacterium]